MIGVGVGVCIAMILVAFAYYRPPFFYGFSTFYLCLAPACAIYELPLERVTPLAQVTIVLFIAMSNALIYGITFLAIAKIWVRFRGKSL